jgi:hypothetical protein
LRWWEVKGLAPLAYAADMWTASRQLSGKQSVFPVVVANPGLQ